MNSKRQPSERAKKLLKEMDTHAKDLLDFLDDLQSYRKNHTLEFTKVEDETTKNIKNS